MKTQYKRHNDWIKAIRKQNICRHVYGWEWYDNLHAYSKGKIHCSCPLCRGENPALGKNSRGQKTIRDQKQLEKIEDMEKEEI